MFEQNSKKEVKLSNSFSGYIYIMSAKEDIEAIKKSKFSFKNDIFQDVEENSYHDFNIRYHNKTYFSVKQIKIESIDSLKISTDYTEKILLVLRNKKNE